MKQLYQELLFLKKIAIFCIEVKKHSKKPFLNLDFFQFDPLSRFQFAFSLFSILVRPLLSTNLFSQAAKICHFLAWNSTTGSKPFQTNDLKLIRNLRYQRKCSFDFIAWTFKPQLRNQNFLLLKRQWRSRVKLAWAYLSFCFVQIKNEIQTKNFFK